MAVSKVGEGGFSDWGCVYGLGCGRGGWVEGAGVEDWGDGDWRDGGNGGNNGGG